MINQCTKFEVSRFTRYDYEAVNNGANAENGVVWAVIRGTQRYGQCHHSIEHIRYLIRL